MFTVTEIDVALSRLVHHRLQGASLITWKPLNRTYPNESHFIVLWRRLKSYDKIEYGTHHAMLDNGNTDHADLVTGHYIHDDWEKAVKDYSRRIF